MLFQGRIKITVPKIESPAPIGSRSVSHYNVMQMYRSIEAQQAAGLNHPLRKEKTNE